MFELFPLPLDSDHELFNKEPFNKFSSSKNPLKPHVVDFILKTSKYLKI